MRSTHIKRAPASDLWPGVSARIDPRPARRATLTTRRFAFTLPQLVAASLALIVASGGMVWLARMGGPATDFPPVLGEVRPANFGDAAYDVMLGDCRWRVYRMIGKLGARIDVLRKP